MTKKDYIKYTGKFLEGKKGITLEQIKNRGGSIIEKGEVVTFSGKSGKGGFNIRSVKTAISISSVDYESVDLLP